MASTAQNTQKHSDHGVAPTDLHAAIVAGPANDNTFQNNGRTSLHVVTNATGPVNITIKNQTVQEGSAGPDLVVNVPASSTRVIGNIPMGLFNDSNGLMHVQVDTPANLTTFYAFQS